MSAATPTAPAGAAPAKGKMKLIIIIVVVAVLVLGLAGVGALLMMKKSAAAHDDEEVDAPVVAVSTRDLKSTPVFAPLEPFTVNLADKDSDRYAQVGITLEMTDQASADALKTFMPAVRNNLLMLLAHKTSTELLGRDGKEQLAEEVRRETARGLGYELPTAEDEDEAETPRSKSRRKRAAEPVLPITAVYFSTFIIQ